MIRKIIGLVFLLQSCLVWSFFNPMQIAKDISGFDQSKYINLTQLLNKYQPDFAREKRIVSQIEDSIIDGDAEWLKTKQGDIFSIYTEADNDDDKPKGGLIILHSRGFHPNWDTVIKPLRVNLAERGWDTLAVQMPVLDKSAKYYDYVAIFPFARDRITAAIDFYHKKGIKKIILIAHACGSHMAQDFIDKYSVKDIDAFVGIGIGATDYKQKNISPIILSLLDKEIPVLDVVAQYDYPGVLRLASVRREALTLMKNPKNKQIIIPNSGHYYEGDKPTKAMVGSIAYWLDDL